jgi:pectate lyase
VLDIPALLTAITSANGTPETDTICLEAGTYTLDAPITSAMTLVGLGAGAEIIGSLQVSGAGRLTLRNVTVNP